MGYLDYLNKSLEEKEIKKPKEKIVIKVKEKSKEIVENKVEKPITVRKQVKKKSLADHASYILEGVSDFKPKKFDVNTKRIVAKDIPKRELNNNVLHAGHLL